MSASWVALAGGDLLPSLPSLCEVLHPSDVRIKWDCHRLLPGESLESLFHDRWIDVARFNRLDRRHARPGVSIKVPRRLEDIERFTPLPRVYPPAASDDRFILVDLSEQFLGAYERGRLVRSTPVTTGEPGHDTPTGDYRILAAHLRHQSNLYTIDQTEIPYPMHSALLFFEDPERGQYWIHGRDMPGQPVSRGCIGLYDEPMQHEYYGTPTRPLMDDARWLYRWVVPDRPDDEGPITLVEGPRVSIIGRAPTAQASTSPSRPTASSGPCLRSAPSR